MSRVWISKILDRVRKKSGVGLIFFVSLIDCDSSDNTCSLFQKSDGF